MLLFMLVFALLMYKNRVDIFSNVVYYKLNVQKMDKTNDFS